MANIKVHILNFHGLSSHIELLLENTSIEPHTYYSINRWDRPDFGWSMVDIKHYIDEASSTYSFNIKADPDEITKRWRQYWYDTSDSAFIAGTNCAVAAQWFLTEFAAIPEPDLSNISLNHVLLGAMWPSFIPCPVALPGRIMSNAKFHVEARSHPESAAQYTHLFLYTSLALSAMACFASIYTLFLATKILSEGLAGLAILTSIGAVSCYGFFKAYNTVSAKNYPNQKKNEESLLIHEDDDILLSLVSVDISTIVA
jgi:hypothetical protein